MHVMHGFTLVYIYIFILQKHEASGVGKNVSANSDHAFEAIVAQFYEGIVARSLRVTELYMKRHCI